MSENAWTAVLTGILATMTGILGYMANTLSGLRKDLYGKVDKDACGKDMDRHCTRLDHLETDVRNNTADIAALKAKIDD